MTAAFLQSELASLISDSKRKQSDIRTAAEKSLADLKSISVTSETQLAGDLLRKSQFIDPFVLACNSKYARLAVTGTVCLQRLVASRAIPRGRLIDVLDAFQEASTQGLDVQLKILQALPSLFQLYATELRGESLAKILSLCAGLAGSKTGMVSSTATATFQQLVSSVFQGRTRFEQESASDGQFEESAIDDASRTFNDMCMVVKNEQPQFLKLQGLSLTLSLDVIENCLSSDELQILDIPECLSTCEQYLLPGLTAHLEKASNFQTFAHCLRIIYILMRDHLDKLYEGIAEAVHVILDWLDRGTAASWRRLLCLEFVKTICSDFQTFRLLYAAFDLRDNQRRVIQDLMAILVRIVAEDPGLIGLGRQSTIPTNSATDSSTGISGSVEVQDLDAVGSVMQANSNVTGISARWSTIPNPLLEQKERSNAPEVPETYVYTVVLGCVAAFSEGLSKFVMPLSVPTRPSSRHTDNDERDEDADLPERRNSQRAQKYQRLLNPLKRENLSNIGEVEQCSRMVEDCWPAVLATCSTFLNSALDSQFYHILVRTVQKLAQVSGVMELHTPRDALLTTLAKVSVPLNSSSLIAILHGNKPAKRHSAEPESEDEVSSMKSPVQSTPRPSVDISRQSLNVRNLLCLRALLNLGIALGPTLSDASWFIIIQALQQVEALMSVSPTAKSAANTPNPQNAEAEGQTSLSTEIMAVGTASKRMMESTRTYSDSTFAVLIRSVFKTVDDLTPLHTNGASEDGETKQPSLTPRTPRMHRSTRSVSGAFSSSTVLKVEADFVLKTVSDLARVNLYRFTSRGSKSCSWDLIVARLLHVVAGNDIDTSIRLQAATTIDVIAMEAIKISESQKFNLDDLDSLHQACLTALSKQLKLLYRIPDGQQEVLSTEMEIHRRLLEALENIVSHAGDRLTKGWRTIFETLQITVKRDEIRNRDLSRQTTTSFLDAERMLRTVPPAFRTIQLIVSDFLSSIDSESLWVLVQLLPLFGMQENDVNISLTTATLFWNINGLILQKTETINVTDSLSAELSPVDDPDSVIAAETSTLWFATMMHLAELCGDPRSDVRNGALRVMLRIFDASSDQLTPEMWNLSIRKVLLPLLLQYSDIQPPQTHWHASFASLLPGTVSLMSNHIDPIMKSSIFPDTWGELVFVLASMLSQRTQSGHLTVFLSATELIHAIRKAGSCRKELVISLLHLWLEHHPANIPHHDELSQQVYLAHTLLFTELYACNYEAVEAFSARGQSLSDLVMQSVKRTIFTSIQLRYDDDVKKMTRDQEAVVTNIAILLNIPQNSRDKYSSFLLDIVETILSRHQIPVTEQQSAALDQKRIQQPRLIALMSKCIGLLQMVVPVKVTGADWTRDIVAPRTMQVLAGVVTTKYTGMPCNESSPAWQAATTAAVKIVEATSDSLSYMENNELQFIFETIPRLTEAILNAPALEQKKPPPTDQQILADENFDSICFVRLHKALVPILQQSTLLENARKEYALALFHASLIAKPWFRDFPADLLHEPLSDFKTIRAGSIRNPDFYVRGNISYEAANALFGLVARHQVIEQAGSEMTTSTMNSTFLVSRAAVPYFLLRIAHTIKTFLTDQRLRQLNPPPVQLRKELNFILARALEIRCSNRAFMHLLSTSSSVTKVIATADASSNSLRLDENDDDSDDNDGKEHLRILYPWILQLKQFWTELPRLRVCAWQDEEDGIAVTDTLKRWSEVLIEGWSI